MGTKVFDSDEDDEDNANDAADKENVEANFQNAIEEMIPAKRRQATVAGAKRGRKVAKRA